MTRNLLAGALFGLIAPVAISAPAFADESTTDDAMQVSSTASNPTADLSITSFDAANAVAPISIVEGPGIKVGQGTTIHPVFGIETGFVSNVFYNENPEPAGILRLMGQISVASLNRQRLDPSAPNMTDTDGDDRGDFQYKASLRLAYDQPLASSDTITATGGVGIGAGFKGMVNPSGRFSFGFDENFLRMIRASNFETQTNENRDINNLQLTFLYHPPDRSMSGYLYYRNMIDIFEKEDTLYPNRIDHRIGVHPMWRVFPQTMVYADFSLGFVDGLGASPESEMKNSSMPLILKAGVTSLLTTKVALNFAAGYTNGFYANGPSFSAPVFDVDLSYRYSPLGKLQVGYSLAYMDSVNANFYRDHIIRAQVQQLFVPFALMIEPELHFRQYQGVTVTGTTGGIVRDDVIFAVTGGMYYNFRNWIAATLNYKFTTIETDFRYIEMGGRTVDPSFNRHDLLLGLRMAM